MSVIDKFNSNLVSSNEAINRNLRISNIKISAKTSTNLKILEQTEKCLTYSTKQYNILKFDKFTATILGKNHNYLNITGIQTFEEISSSLVTFFKFFNEYITPHDIETIKIDSISLCFKLKPSLKYHLMQLSTSKFKITKPPRFPGILIRDKNKSYSVTYFSSGKCIAVGLRNVAECNNVYNEMCVLTNDKDLEKLVKNGL